MIIDNSIIIIGNSRNIKHYKSLGYDISINASISINPNDLMPTSKYKINAKCNDCSSIINKSFANYIKTINSHGVFLCKKCKTLKTNMEVFGVSSPLKNANIRNKMMNTNLEKYGVTCTLHNDTIKDKVKKTNLERYGSEYSTQNEVVKNKKSNTNLEKYGASSPLGNDIIMDKMMNTNLEKYGVRNVFQSVESKDKIKKNNLERYGVEFYSQTNEMKDKSKKTSIEKYGSEFYGKSNDFIVNLIKGNEEKYLSNGFIIKGYNKTDDKSFGTYTLHSDSCNHTFDISTDLYYSRYKYNSTICTICNPVGISNISEREISLLNFIKENYDKEIISNYRKNRLEIDVYLPDLNLGFEFNGLYWHSELYKDKNYHLNKTIKFNTDGIQLIHIWEDDWIYKQDIVKSMILNKLSRNTNKIYARKCKIKEVVNKECNLFLDKNHIQGKCSSSLNLGLYYNSELVSLMTFGIRGTNGKSEYELIRFCSILNTSVIGGASKIFKYFINNFEYTKIVSYSDNCHSIGSIYEKLNFKKEALSKVNYYWIKNDRRYHRYTFNKKRLIKMGYDPNKTEVQIMHELGYYRIWGCGHIKWVYKK